MVPHFGGSSNRRPSQRRYLLAPQKAANPDIRMRPKTMNCQKICPRLLSIRRSPSQPQNTSRAQRANEARRLTAHSSTKKRPRNLLSKMPYCCSHSYSDAAKKRRNHHQNERQCEQRTNHNHRNIDYDGSKTVTEHCLCPPSGTLCFVPWL